MKALTLNIIKNNSKASSFLDLLRFLAALTVFLFHFYVPLPGYQSVMIFFVLSGYVISSSVLRKVTKNQWNWSDYLLKRITRLWIVLLPCLFLTLGWASLQLNIFAQGKFRMYLDWETFLGNLFFLQGIKVNIYGLNGPLWSLSYEFWYYILFPCLVLIIFSKKLLHRIFYVSLFIIISYFVGQKIMFYFLVWLLGAIIPLIKPLKIRAKFAQIGLMIIFVTISFLSTKSYIYMPQTLADLSIGIAFGVLIYLNISFYNIIHINPIYKIPKYLAGFSYTLYLVHYPLANFIFNWLGSPLWPYKHTPILIKFILAISVLVYAWIIASLTEKHTDTVRKLIIKFVYKEKSMSLKSKNSISKI